MEIAITDIEVQLRNLSRIKADKHLIAAILDIARADNIAIPIPKCDQRLYISFTLYMDDPSRANINKDDSGEVRIVSTHVALLDIVDYATRENYYVTISDSSGYTTLGEQDTIEFDVIVPLSAILYPSCNGKHAWHLQDYNAAILQEAWNSTRGGTKFTLFRAAKVLAEYGLTILDSIGIAFMLNYYGHERATLRDIMDEEDLFRKSYIHKTLESAGLVILPKWYEQEDPYLVYTPLDALVELCAPTSVVILTVEELANYNKIAPPNAYYYSKDADGILEYTTGRPYATVIQQITAKMGDGCIALCCSGFQVMHIEEDIHIRLIQQLSVHRAVSRALEFHTGICLDTPKGFKVDTIDHYVGDPQEKIVRHPYTTKQQLLLIAEIIGLRCKDTLSIVELRVCILKWYDIVYSTTKMFILKKRTRIV